MSNVINIFLFKNLLSCTLIWKVWQLVLFTGWLRSRMNSIGINKIGSIQGGNWEDIEYRNHAMYRRCKKI